VKREIINLFFSEKPEQEESLFAMGHVLKAERTRQGHRLKAVAESVGITPAYISQLESGKKLNPTFRVISDYLNFLGLDMMDMILRMKVTESPAPDQLDKLISGIEDTLETLRVIRKLGGEKNEKS